jgi:branched-chain amino acid transport system substrate-binding protein
VALVVPLSGANAIPRIYVDPTTMAVDEINAAGGVNGHQLVLDKIDSGFTPATAITAVNKAVSDKASVIIGIPVTPQVQAVKKVIDQAKIPLLQLSIGDEDSYLGDSGTGGSKYSFRIGDANSTQVKAATKFAVDELKAKKVGLLADIDSSKSVKDTFESELKSSGGTLGSERTFALTATDLTNEVLAMKGSDAVIAWSYPNSQALALKQLQQNGLKVPVIGSQSAGNVFSNSLVPAAMFQYLYGAATCNPVDDTRPSVATWLSSFKAKFNWTPDQSSAEAYDAVKIFAEVFGKANGADLLPSLQSLNYTSGVCAAAYKADSKGNTVQTALVIGYSTGSAKTVKTYDFSAG